MDDEVDEAPPKAKGGKAKGGKAKGDKPAKGKSEVPPGSATGEDKPECKQQ